jgi:hypothetical protein
MTEQERRWRPEDGSIKGRFWATLRTLDVVFQKSGALISLVIATFSVGIAFYAVYSLQAESEERRDQMCRLFEGDHMADVIRLERTYEFLDRTGKTDLSNSLRAEILRSLPELEREARNDSAPEFCDEEGIGLPEPDPVLPPRRSFGDLGERP